MNSPVIVFRLFFLALLVLLVTCGTSAAQDEAVSIRIYDNPAVQSAMETERDSPDDYLRAVLALVDLGEPKLAQPILDELVGLGLDDAAKVELVEEFGSARLLRLARAEGLSDAAKEFSKSCLAAAGQAASNSERLAELTKQLLSEPPASAGGALTKLRRVGTPAVVHLLEELGKRNEQTERDRLRDALVALAPLSSPALVAALGSPNEDVRTHAAWALGQTEDHAAAPLLAAQAVLEPAGSNAGRAAAWAVRYLYGDPVGSQGAIRLLRQSLENARQGVSPHRPNSNDRVTVYLLAGEDKTAYQPVELSSDDAATIHATRLAKALFRLAPTDARAERLAVVLELERSALLESSLGNVDVTITSDHDLDPKVCANHTLTSSLQLALDSRYAGAAMKIAELLAERGDSSVLQTADGRPGALTEALADPHPAVRFAALRAIMKLSPLTPFPGSSRVAPALIDFASGTEDRLAVVAMPNIDRSANVAGNLAAAGFDGRVGNNGTEAIRLASQAGVELVLVDLAILRPGVRETIFQLRRQTGSAEVPIGILAPEGRLGEAKRIAQDHQRVIAFPRPHNTDAASDIARRLTETATAFAPSPTQRAGWANEARGWIAGLLDEGPEFYALRSRADAVQFTLTSTRQSSDTIDALALLGTPESQVELADDASQGPLPIETRRQAAAAFRQSVERFGLLLTTRQIHLQYDRYNASESADRETQQVLASLLDTIEALRNRRLPTAPLPAPLGVTEQSTPLPEASAPTAR